jgi:DNA-binding transcriptional regulator YiaG
MPNLAKILREEVQRLAKKQVRTGLTPLRRDNIRLKRTVADLRRQVDTLARANRDLATKVSSVVGPMAAERTAEQAPKLRPTSKSLARLRRRLDLTQAEFGRLIGVTGQAVMHWEGKGSRVRMRNANLVALAGIQNIGKREARRRLESGAEAS